MQAPLPRSRSALPIAIIRSAQSGPPQIQGPGRKPAISSPHPSPSSAKRSYKQSARATQLILEGEDGPRLPPRGAPRLHAAAPNRLAEPLRSLGARWPALSYIIKAAIEQRRGLLLGITSVSGRSLDEARLGGRLASRSHAVRGPCLWRALVGLEIV